jgi:hypothetical protein
MVHTVNTRRETGIQSDKTKRRNGEEREGIERNYK